MYDICCFLFSSRDDQEPDVINLSGDTEEDLDLDNEEGGGGDDSSSSGSDDSEDSDASLEGLPGSTYGGYGRCYRCGEEELS